MTAPSVEASRRSNRRQYVKKQRLGLCVKCGDPDRKPEPGFALCTVCRSKSLDRYYDNRESQLSAQQKYMRRLRVAAITAYGGPTCACCGDMHEEFLTIDHEQGMGSQHRKEIGRGGHTFYLWLQRNKYPRGFRVLCMNCNFSIGIRGYCPHQKEKEAMDKFGVQEDLPEDLEKKAAAGCPVCGATPVRHGNVLMCPTHGSEPFEKPEEKK